MLEAEREKIEPEYRDELTNSIDARFGEIEATLTAFAERLTFDPADIARAGVFVNIMHDGDLRVERGFVRPEGEPPAVPQATAKENPGTTAIRPMPLNRLSPASSVPSSRSADSGPGRGKRRRHHQVPARACRGPPMTIGAATTLVALDQIHVSPARLGGSAHELAAESV